MLMSEKELCQHICKALDRRKCNTWYTVKILDGEKVATFEAIAPTKGNIKIRKPFKKSFSNKYFYILYRITNKMSLYDMGLIEDEKPQNIELIVYDVRT